MKHQSFFMLKINAGHQALRQLIFITGLLVYLMAWDPPGPIAPFCYSQTSSLRFSFPWAGKGCSSVKKGTSFSWKVIHIFDLDLVGDRLVPVFPFILLSFLTSQLLIGWPIANSDPSPDIKTIFHTLLSQLL